ncbi:hypothetical protein [Mycolicibacterium sp.]|uniref:hypothetical protein n=1 Tax=Mycolicibacterium sp. TaxID=2320850 RepID=UPI001D7B041C|nr:hypothetical protein [Mycolicibacterium sp.]MCB1265686.1 hypothetical protein [Mycobacterium sp.]MCB1289413.1 hypothetical protein [Mycobacterium sp.]MCB9409955.1 hypothetical protein [Mycolicibacterium sp.]
MSVEVRSRQEAEATDEAVSPRFEISPRLALVLLTLTMILTAVIGIFLHGQSSVGL